MTQDVNYRADIDGLLALAVVSVLFFHVGFGAFSGGFVGVDVLFVISGFVITRSIRNEVLSTGSFRFSQFYLRGGQRFLPAFFFTLAATFGVAYLLFPPTDLQRLGGVLVHAAAGVSNFFFWSEGGYFEAVSSFRPLLHTWSVSVGAQVYLVWPACLVFLLLRTPRFAVPISLAVVALLSFLLSLSFADGEVELLTAIAPRAAAWFSNGPANVFYLAPFRVFEFAIGGCVVWAVGWPPSNRFLEESLAMAGLFMIGTSIFFCSAVTPFPSVYGLLPCLGTVLVLYAGTARFATRLLGGWPAKLGRISYSLYLVHWPIAVFLRYTTQYEPNVVVGALISVVSVVLAAIMYRWVERPFRCGARGAGAWSPGAFGFACAIYALGISFLSASTWANQGWAWRFGQRDAAQAFGEVDTLSLERKQFLNRHRASYFLHPDQTRNLLVVGDGLADDLVIALTESLDHRFEAQAERYLARCHGIFSGRGEPADDECSEILAALDFSLTVRNADEIYIAFDLQPTAGLDEFAPLVAFLRERAQPDVRIVLFGSGPRFPKFQGAAVRMLADGASIEDVEKTARRLRDTSPDVDRRIQAAAEQLGIEFISRYDILCSDERCKFFIDDDSLMFLDPLRLTVRGAKWYGERVATSLFGEEILEAPRPRVAGGSNAVIEAYSEVLDATAIDGNTVFDVDRLPDSKDRIRLVLLRALQDSSDPEEQEVLKAGVMTLAFFQPDVGEDGAPLDSAGPVEGTWRDVVEADLKVTAAALIDLGHTF